MFHPWSLFKIHESLFCVIFVFHNFHSIRTQQTPSYNQCTVSSHVYQNVHFNCKALWHPKICLFVLQTITSYKMIAVAGTLTEHNQLRHVHVHSFNCRYTVLRYTVLLLHTRCLILKGKTELLVHFRTSEFIHYISAQAKNSFILYHKIIHQSLYVNIYNTTTITTNDNDAANS